MTLPALQTDEQLLTLLRAGDSAAEALLYERYKPVVRSKARTYFLVGADREDIIQEGMIGLYKAVCDYAPDRQASFHAFADLCITRQIITAIKRATRKKHLPLNTYVSLNSTVFDDNSERTLADILASASDNDPEAAYLMGESLAAMQRGIAHALTKLERDVLNLYLDGLSYQQIADTLHRSTKCIDNAIQRVKRKLETQLRGMA